MGTGGGSYESGVLEGKIKMETEVRYPKVFERPFNYYASGFNKKLPHVSCMDSLLLEGVAHILTQYILEEETEIRRNIWIVPIFKYRQEVIIKKRRSDFYEKCVGEDPGEYKYVQKKLYKIKGKQFYAEYPNDGVYNHIVPVLKIDADKIYVYITVPKWLIGELV
jgi:hypothetical protein